MLFLHAARTMFWRLVPLQTCLDWSLQTFFPDLTVGINKRRPMRKRGSTALLFVDADLDPSCGIEFLCAGARRRAHSGCRGERRKETRIPATAASISAAPYRPDRVGSTANRR